MARRTGGRTRRRSPLGLEALEPRDVPAVVHEPYAPYGPELTVNTPPDPLHSFTEVQSAVDADDAGDSVVAWVRFPLTTTDASGSGVFFQRVGRDGTAVGGPVLVSAYDRDGIYPEHIPYDSVDVALDADGDFVVAYAVSVIPYPDQNVSETYVYAQRYTASGAAVGDPILLDSAYSDGVVNRARVGRPRVAMDDAGDFVVTWYSGALGKDADGYDTLSEAFYAQVFSAAGPAVTGPLLVQSFAGYQATGEGDSGVFESVDMGANGQFVVTWARVVPPEIFASHDAALDAVYARRYTPAGVALGSAFQVSQAPAGLGSPRVAPTVAVSPSGGFVVAWGYNYQIGGDFVRQYDAAGVALGDEVQVNQSDLTTSGGSDVDVGMDKTGAYVVTWRSAEWSPRLFAQRFEADGTRSGDNVVLKTDPNLYYEVMNFDSLPGEVSPAVAVDADGDLTVNWLQVDPYPGTVGVWDVYARRWVRADFDVQDGLSERSFVRTLTVTFSPQVDVAGLLAAGRLRLTQFGLDGSGPGQNVPLAGLVTVVGQTLRIDFGPGGLGGNPNSAAADGYYVLEADLNGDGQLEADWRFHRLLGDVTGDGAVDDADLAQVQAAIGGAYDPEADVNGDGVVDAADLSLATAAYGRWLSPDLERND
jgi:hypothetical protein